VPWVEVDESPDVVSSPSSGSCVGELDLDGRSQWLACAPADDGWVLLARARRNNRLADDRPTLRRKNLAVVSLLPGHDPDLKVPHRLIARVLILDEKPVADTWRREPPRGDESRLTSPPVAN
jgi:hypothetical protein